MFTSSVHAASTLSWFYLLCRCLSFFFFQSSTSEGLCTDLAAAASHPLHFKPNANSQLLHKLSGSNLFFSLLFYSFFVCLRTNELNWTDKLDSIDLQPMSSSLMLLHSANLNCHKSKSENQCSPLSVDRSLCSLLMAE